MRQRKRRRCKICGAELRPEDLWLCDNCQASGEGRRFLRKKSVDGPELLRVAYERSNAGRDPLHLMEIEEINELARVYGKTYNSYGKLRGYVSETGKLPAEMMQAAMELTGDVKELDLKQREIQTRKQTKKPRDTSWHGRYCGECAMWRNDGTERGGGYCDRQGGKKVRRSKNACQWFCVVGGGENG